MTARTLIAASTLILATTLGATASFAQYYAPYGYSYAAPYAYDYYGPYHPRGGPGPRVSNGQGMGIGSVR
jgi:hypothetical protein